MKKAESNIIEIRPIETKLITIRIVGDTPLIVHAWSAKAKREMHEKQIGATKTKARDPKNPFEDFCSSLYWLDPMPEVFTRESVEEAMSLKPRFGFPVTGIKQAAITASYQLGWTPNKTSLRGAFFLVPDAKGYYSGDLDSDLERKKVDIIPNVFKPDSLAEIHSPEPPSMREDMVRLGGMGSPADIRYRGQFENWSMNLTISYNANGQYSIEQIVNIINAGGYACGIGEWRPEKDGQYGMFHVEQA